MRIKLNTEQIQYVKTDRQARVNSFSNCISHKGYLSRTILRLYYIERFIF